MLSDEGQGPLRGDAPRPGERRAAHTGARESTRSTPLHPAPEQHLARCVRHISKLQVISKFVDADIVFHTSMIEPPRQKDTTVDTQRQN